MATVHGNARLARHVADIDDSGHHTTTPALSEPVEVVTASGASQDIDYSVAHWWDITLTANCALTISNPPASSIVGDLVVVLRQGGSGSYTVTWPAEVDWQDTDGTGGGAAPTLHTVVTAQDVIELVTFDAGTSWGGSHEGGSTAASTTMWRPVMVEDGATGLWYVTVTGDGDAVMTEVPV